MEVESNYYDPEAILAEETVSRRDRRRRRLRGADRRPSPTPKRSVLPEQNNKTTKQVVPCTFRYGVATLAKVLLPASHSRDVSFSVLVLPPARSRREKSKSKTRR